MCFRNFNFDFNIVNEKYFILTIQIDAITFLPKIDANNWLFIYNVKPQIEKI